MGANANVAFLLTTVLLLGTKLKPSLAEDFVRPNYITEAEFAAIEGYIIPVINTTVLQLPAMNSSPLLHHNYYPDHEARPGFGPNTWPNARVPYVLDSTFNDDQRAQVTLAFKNYHDNTCIRFVPKQDGDDNYVFINQDSKVCGSAYLCMIGGQQTASFGGSCITSGVMTHELGHTLCMGHEQSRLDRDDWISFNTDICQAPGKDSSDFKRGLNKLYDYVSIEHYEGECYSGCFIPKESGVTKCGSGGTLSVLDIEILNEVYGCTSGCLGYRYVNSKSDSLSNLVEAGKETNGDTMYSCRAYHEGDIIPGKYHAGRGECYVPYNGGEHTKTGNYIEILTNPYGMKLKWTESGSLPSKAIRGGRSNERETLYVIRCKLTIDGTDYWTPGKYQPSAGAYTSYGGNEYTCDKFQYLICDQ